MTPQPQTPQALTPQAHAKIRVLAVDDHPLVRKGIASILANEEDMELVGEAGDGRGRCRSSMNPAPTWC